MVMSFIVEHKLQVAPLRSTVLQHTHAKTDFFLRYNTDGIMALLAPFVISLHVISCIVSRLVKQVFAKDQRSCT